MTYADEVLEVLRTLVTPAGETDPHHEARVLDMSIDGADAIVVVYEHRRYAGRFGLRRNVVAGATDDREDAIESATMVHIELDEPPPPNFDKVDSDGVQWWGDFPTST